MHLSWVCNPSKGSLFHQVMHETILYHSHLIDSSLAYPLITTFDFTCRAYLTAYF